MKTYYKPEMIVKIPNNLFISGNPSFKYPEFMTIWIDNHLLGRNVTSYTIKYLNKIK